jgi:Opacity protein and related surface antigens
MKKAGFVSIILALLLMCGSAHAGDGAGSTYNWTGFYAGINIGGAINDSTYKLSPSGLFSGSPTNSLRTDSGSFDDTAFTGGAQLGYNYQVCHFVFGLETDFNYNGVDESDSVNRALSSPLNGRLLHTVKQTIDYFGTFRARAGFTPFDRLLVYGTGGLAYGHVCSSSNVLFTLGGDNYVGSKSDIRTGWTAGGGSEYAVTNNWTLRIEYLFVDLGKQSYSYTNQYYPGYDYKTDIENQQHVIRLGINYKF